MNNGEVIDVLSVITAYDGRNAGAAELNVWAEAAKRGRWRFADAVDAVHEHYAESTAWLMPGHVTERIRRKRADPPRSNALPQATPRPAADAHIRRVCEWVADRLAVDREATADERRSALAVDCPHCGAVANSPCVQTIGPAGKPRDGYRPIEVPHLQRRQAYRNREE